MDEAIAAVCTAEKDGTLTKAINAAPGTLSHQHDDHEGARCPEDLGAE